MYVEIKLDKKAINGKKQKQFETIKLDVCVAKTMGSQLTWNVRSQWLRVRKRRRVRDGGDDKRSPNLSGIDIGKG